LSSIQTNELYKYSTCYTSYMTFPKDILVIDFEGKKQPLQIGAILLDKETLEEKDSYVSYIYADIGDFVSPVSGISQETIKDAPTQAEVGKQLYEKFGSNIFIASWVQNLDITHWETLMKAAGIDFLTGPTSAEKYDYHIMDIWVPAYLYALNNGYTGSTRSEEMFQWFGAQPRGLHDALEDCRITAEVLRKVCQ
jgi:DNA polymerase III epsilon subunit-like protein